MRPTARRRAVGLAVLSLALAVGCGGGDDDGDARDLEAESPLTGSTDGPNGTAVDPDADPADRPARLDAEAVCAIVAPMELGSALGVVLAEGVPSPSSTPQCSYDILLTGDGPSGNVTVAALRPDADLGGRTGVEAFEHAVALNAGVGGEDVEQVDVAAGTRAVRLSGAALHLGVVLVDDQVLTLIVPVDSAGGPAVDSALAAIADALAR